MKDRTRSTEVSADPSTSVPAKYQRGREAEFEEDYQLLGVGNDAVTMADAPGKDPK
jgi:hypothetical protein